MFPRRLGKSVWWANLFKNVTGANASLHAAESVFNPSGLTEQFTFAPLGSMFDRFAEVIMRVEVVGKLVDDGIFTTIIRIFILFGLRRECVHKLSEVGPENRKSVVWGTRVARRV